MTCIRCMERERAPKRRLCQRCMDVRNRLERREAKISETYSHDYRYLLSPEAQRRLEEMERKTQGGRV